jgi:hypothetical protein
MKTIQVNLYQFSELSDKAKETALQNFINSSEFFWGDDWIKSIEGLMEHFNSSFDNYSIDWLEGYRNSFKISIPDYMNNITKDELKGYIKSMGSYNKETLRGNGDCKFTGYCGDEDAADGVRKAYFAGERDLHELLMAGYNSWYEAANKDAEFEQTMEFFADHTEANDYDFLEDGTMA